MRIKNAHNTVTDLADYIIGHTRMMPRDIVIVGNKLCGVIRELQDQAQTPVARLARIRRVVLEEARHFGQEQLRVCANQIISDAAPRDSSRRNYSDAYLHASYSLGHEDSIKRMLRIVNNPRLTNTQTRQLRELAAQEFGSHADLIQILWEHRLLGRRVRDGHRKVNLYYDGSDIDFVLRDDEETYVLHPITCASAGVTGRADHKGGSNT